MFPHRSAASTSLDAAPARLRSARFSLADNCRAGGPAALLSGEQCKGECELGLWSRRKSAADSARAALCGSPDAVVPARCLSANAPSFRQNFSSRRILILRSLARSYGLAGDFVWNGKCDGQKKPHDSWKSCGFLLVIPQVARAQSTTT